tara:strand:- start:492 stop:662 length:171 start_codon:yes stop_codon:yes gene_type:complete
MQKYIVEIFNQKFEKVAESGPASYEKAHDVVKGYKAKGFLVTITEEELIDVDESFI